MSYCNIEDICSLENEKLENSKLLKNIYLFRVKYYIFFLSKSEER